MGAYTIVAERAKGEYWTANLWNYDPDRLRDNKWGIVSGLGGFPFPTKEGAVAELSSRVHPDEKPFLGVTDEDNFDTHICYGCSNCCPVSL